MNDAIPMGEKETKVLDRAIQGLGEDREKIQDIQRLIHYSQQGPGIWYLVYEAKSWKTKLKNEVSPKGKGQDQGW